MAWCECLAKCPFFNEVMSKLTATSGVMMRRYCPGDDKEKCARYMVFKSLGREKVPVDLCPNEIDFARETIAFVKRKND